MILFREGASTGSPPTAATTTAATTLTGALPSGSHSTLSNRLADRFISGGYLAALQAGNNQSKVAKDGKKPITSQSAETGAAGIKMI
jgi:hypothetical protein